MIHATNPMVEKLFHFPAHLVRKSHSMRSAIPGGRLQFNSTIRYGEVSGYLARYSKQGEQRFLMKSALNCCSVKRVNLLARSRDLTSCDANVVAHLRRNFRSPSNGQICKETDIFIAERKLTS
jgi:hypothetical protein